MQKSVTRSALTTQRRETTGMRALNEQSISNREAASTAPAPGGPATERGQGPRPIRPEPAQKFQHWNTKENGRNESTMMTVCMALAAMSSTGCGDTSEPSAQDDVDQGESEARRYVLCSVSIDADGNRMSYAQIIDELEGYFSNEKGIEATGNAVARKL
jgi:hypothetical protein